MGRGGDVWSQARRAGGNKRRRRGRDRVRRVAKPRAWRLPAATHFHRTSARYMEQDTTSPRSCRWARCCFCSACFPLMRIFASRCFAARPGGPDGSGSGAAVSAGSARCRWPAATILVAIGIDVPIQLYNRLREACAGRFPAASRRNPRVVVRETVCLLASPSGGGDPGPALVFFCCGLSVSAA